MLDRLRRIVLIGGLALAPAAVAGIYDDILAAANRDDTPQVIDLLARGMDVNTVDPMGNTLLMIAARNGNMSLLDFLLRNRANLAKRNKFGDSALMLAAYRGNVPTVQRLLAAGAEIDSSAGWNAMHYAAFNGRTDVLRLLVQQPNVPLDAKAPNGQTALMLAASAGQLPAVEILIAADADMDIEDSEGRTALTLAEARGHEAVADFLREAGADE